MRQIIRTSALLAVLCFTSQLVFAHKDVEPRDDAEAAHWIQESLRSFSNVKIGDGYVQYQQGSGITLIILPRISDISSTQEKRSSYPYCVYWRDYVNDGPEHVCWGYRWHKDSERFAAALEYLSAEARHKMQSEIDADWAHFQEQLKPWREATAKPTMPEAAREHQVLAEYAFKEKNTEKAMLEYAEALKVFSTWPEGQFNLATLCGEAKHYQCAVQHMKEYLELAPNSPDAQAAKDSIIIWNDKLSTFRAAIAHDSTQQPGRGQHPDTAAR